jgi:ankyrin repeat protein
MPATARNAASKAARLAWGEQWRDRKDLGAEMARAAEKGKPDMVKLLLDLGATGYGSQGRNDPMVNAAAKGHVAIVEMLLDHGIAADARGPVCSPLAMAAEAGQLDVCKILLSRGASVNRADPETGHTALHAAAFGGKGGAVIRYLLDHGADANLRRKDGASALAFALAHGRQQSILALLETTENFHNEINEDGRNLLQTYLFNITEPPAMEIVQLLIDKGVAFQHEDKSGYTVLDRALFRAREDIVDLLRGLGAKSRRH